MPTKLTKNINSNTDRGVALALKEALLTLGGSDHDAITTLVGTVANLDKRFTEKFDELKSDIKDLKDGTAQRITNLENEKLNIRDSYPVIYKKGVDEMLNNHQNIINGLQTERTKITVLLGVASTIMMALLGLLISHLFK